MSDLQQISMPTMQIAVVGEPSTAVDSDERADILVVVAHPDDECIGFGGTIAKHVQNGEKVRVLILSEGVDSRMDATNPDRLARLKACNEASNILGFDGEVLTYPDQRFDTVARLDITRAIEKRIAQYRPHTVYTHFHGDMNLDHRITSECTDVACRAVPRCYVKRLLMGEVLSSTEWGNGFAPNWFVELGNVSLDKKLAALEAYGTEMRDPPHARSRIASHRCASARGNGIGVEYAEAFVLVRNVA